VQQCDDTLAKRDRLSAAEQDFRLRGKTERDLVNRTTARAKEKPRR
jgi:hypothetical protein